MSEVVERTPKKPTLIQRLVALPEGKALRITTARDGAMVATAVYAHAKARGVKLRWRFAGDDVIAWTEPLDGVFPQGATR